MPVYENCLFHRAKFFPLNTVCVDTIGWTGNGSNCNWWSNNRCENGGSRAGYEGWLGDSYNNPENNCCACGKKDSNSDTENYGHFINTVEIDTGISCNSRTLKPITTVSLALYVG